MKKLIFLPGLGYKKEIWTDVINLLPKNKYIIYNFDIPAYGSIYNGVKLTFDTYHLWLKDKLKQDKILPPFSLIGYSLGGYISLDYSHNYKSKVEHQVLVSVPLRYPDSDFPHYWNTLINLGLNSKKFQSVLLNIANNHKKIGNIISGRIINLNIGFLTNSDIKSIAECCRDLGVYDWPKLVPSNTVSTLIAYGTKDPAILRIKGTELYSQIPNAKITTFVCNHAIPKLCPEKLADEIANFI